MKVLKLLTIIFPIIMVIAGCSKDNSAMFRGGLERTGVYNSKSLDKLSALKWKFETEGEVDSSPVVTGGVVYFGSWDGNLYAVE